LGLGGTMYHSKLSRTTLDRATIRARKLADGTVSYTAQIRIKRDGVQVYQESQTFARKQATQVWARKRETPLDEPGAIEQAAARNGVGYAACGECLRAPVR